MLSNLSDLLRSVWAKLVVVGVALAAIGLLLIGNLGSGDGTDDRTQAFSSNAIAADSANVLSIISSITSAPRSDVAGTLIASRQVDAGTDELAAATNVTGGATAVDSTGPTGSTLAAPQLEAAVAAGATTVDTGPAPSGATTTGVVAAAGAVTPIPSATNVGSTGATAGAGSSGSSGGTGSSGSTGATTSGAQAPTGTPPPGSTNTPAPAATNTPPAAAAATNTPVVAAPTSTPVPPTNTAVVVATATLVPPTNTSVPPTNTAVPPTNTAQPPTATPTPSCPTGNASLTANPSTVTPGQASSVTLTASGFPCNEPLTVSAFGSSEVVGNTSANGSYSSSLSVPSKNEVCSLLPGVPAGASYSFQVSVSAGGESDSASITLVMPSCT